MIEDTSPKPTEFLSNPDHVTHTYGYDRYITGFHSYMTIILGYYTLVYYFNLNCNGFLIIDRLEEGSVEVWMVADNCSKTYGYDSGINMYNKYDQYYKKITPIL